MGLHLHTSASSTAWFGTDLGTDLGLLNSGVALIAAGRHWLLQVVRTGQVGRPSNPVLALILK